MSFSWDQSAGAPVLDDQDDGEYICGRCMRDQHGRCTERECECCGGQPAA